MPSTMRLDPPHAKPAGAAATIAAFPTSLGWIALATRGTALARLAFGYPDAQAARTGLMQAAGAGANAFAAAAHFEAWDEPGSSAMDSLRDRLVAYADGQADDFADVLIWSDDWTPFQRLILNRCRQIPHGKTQTYAELAASAGRPGAARAVGRTMATNPIPLVIPCHRVVGSAGDLRGFSAFGGLDAKRRLLETEGALERAMLPA